MKQAELVAKLPRQAPIALLTINRLLVRFGEESRKNKEEKGCAQAEQSYATLVNVDASGKNTNNGAVDLT